MEGVLIGTAVLFVLNLVLVMPLTNVSVAHRLATDGIAAEQFDALPEEAKKRYQGIAVGYYILWDVIVLGAAGLIGGLLGYYFIGLSFEAKGWPGMIAFIAASLAGVALVANQGF